MFWILPSDHWPVGMIIFLHSQASGNKSYIHLALEKSSKCFASAFALAVSSSQFIVLKHINIFWILEVTLNTMYIHSFTKIIGHEAMHKGNNDSVTKSRQFKELGSWFCNRDQLQTPSSS